jgi:hypothetical protein
MLTHWKQPSYTSLHPIVHLHNQIELHFVSTTLQIYRICLVWAVPEPRGDVSDGDCTA